MKTTLNNVFPGLGLAACLGLISACGNPGKNNTDRAATETGTQEPVPTTLTQIWKTDTVFTGSESTLYDPENDIIYVSCGNTESGAKDGDGFIALLNPDGSVKTLKWVTGLDAPKGMALLDGKLYVTDIDAVKIINVEQAAVEKTIPVEGAQFLNDLATDGTTIYFSDSRGNVIYSLDPDGTPSAVVDNSAGTNGLECHGGSLYALDKEGLKKYTLPGYEAEVLNTDVKGGDGLVILNDSTFIASRWAGEVYYIRGGESTLLLDTKEGKSNTADIGFIPEKNLVIVPTFMKNEVAAYELK